MPKPQKYKLVLTVVISVLVHILLFALLYLSKQTTQSPIVDSQPNPIIAQLYYYTPPLEPELKEPTPIETIEDLPEQPTPENSPEAEIVEPELALEPELAKQTPEEVPPPATKVVDQAADLPSTVQDVAAEQKNKYQQPVQDLVQGQLNRYQQGKLENLAAQAAKEYRKQLTSPKIITKPQDPFVTEEEKFEQKITTTVDCSSTSNQTVFVVMKLLGGKVKCSEPPPFDSFIQKRLNKTEVLPALEQ